MRHALKLTPLFLFVLLLVMTACTSGNSSQAREELARLNVEYRGNAIKAGNASNASGRVTEANKALANLTVARADIIDP